MDIRGDACAMHMAHQHVPMNRKLQCLPECDVSAAMCYYKGQYVSQYVHMLKDAIIAAQPALPCLQHLGRCRITSVMIGEQHHISSARGFAWALIGGVGDDKHPSLPAMRREERRTLRLAVAPCRDKAMLLWAKSICRKDE